MPFQGRWLSNEETWDPPTGFQPENHRLKSDFWEGICDRSQEGSTVVSNGDIG